MSTITKTEVERLKKEFTSVWNKIEPYIKRRKLTKDTELIEGYRMEIVRTYNNLLTYIADGYSYVNEQQQETLDKLVDRCLKKIRKSFEILKITYTFSENRYTQIDANYLVYEKIEFHESDDTELEKLPSGGIPYKLNDLLQEEVGETSRTDDTEDSEPTADGEDSEEEIDNELARSFQEENADNDSDALVIYNEETEITDGHQQEETDNMPQTKESYLKFAASVINYKYNGEPAKRDGFIADIELVEDVAEADQKQTCFKFIKSRMEGKALECIPDGTTTVQKLIDAIKAEIKNEPSEVIEGRLAALRLEKGNFTRFTEQVEKQAEQYRRSLVNEGISKEKAKEMAIKKTVQLCRKTARTEIVKSVLASTKYETPAEVLAKFVTENEVARKEKHEAENFKGNKNFKGGNNGKNKNTYKNGQKNNKFNKQNNGNSNKNSNSFNKGNKNGNYKENRNRSGEATIRFVQGNAPAPPSGGEQNQEQVFHFPVN